MQYNARLNEQFNEINNDFINKYNIILNNFNVVGSNVLGGLSNIWGGCFLPYDKNFKKIYKNIYFNQIEKKFNIDFSKSKNTFREFVIKLFDENITYSVPNFIISRKSNQKYSVKEDIIELKKKKTSI